MLLLEADGPRSQSSLLPCQTDIGSTRLFKDIHLYGSGKVETDASATTLHTLDHCDILPHRPLQAPTLPPSGKDALALRGIPLFIKAWRRLLLQQR